jgi:hypothetical protein
MKKNIFVILFIIIILPSLFAEKQASEIFTTAMQFPSFSARNLNDNVISVPNQVTKSVEVAILTFSRKDTVVTESWINTFTALYKGNTRTAYSQTAVIGDISIIGGIIVGGIKGILPADSWERFLIYTGDKEKLENSLKISDPSLFYVYVIGKDGFVKWMTSTAAPDDKLVRSMLKSVENELAQPQKKRP